MIRTLLTISAAMFLQMHQTGIYLMGQVLSGPRTIPIIGYRYNFPNGTQCAMVVVPPDSEIGKMPTYVIWAGRGDKDIATRQTVFHSAYEATKYAVEHCRATPRWAKDGK